MMRYEHGDWDSVRLILPFPSQSIKITYMTSPSSHPLQPPTVLFTIYSTSLHTLLSLPFFVFSRLLLDLLHPVTPKNLILA